MQSATSCRPRVALIMFMLSASAGLPSSDAAVMSREKVYGEPSADEALVYLIREGRFAGSARTMFIYADDSFLGVLDSGTYTFAYVEPGTHLLWTNWTRQRREIDLVPGHVYYIEVWNGFDVLDQETGKALIEKVDGYAIPRPKEVATAAEQIRERYGKALRVEGRMEKAEVEDVEAMERPVDSEGLIQIDAYTEIPLELMENVTSYLNPTGDKVWFRVSSDVVVEGQVVIAAGTRVQGTLRHSAKGARSGVGGNFDIVVPAAETVDGSRVPLLGRVDATGKRRTKAAVAVATGTALATGLATGGLVAIAVAFPRGKEAFLLNGEEFDAWTRHDHWIRIASELAPSSATAPPAERALRVRPLGAIEFHPQKRRSPSKLRLALEAPSEVESVVIDEINGWQLPMHLEPDEIAQEDDALVLSFIGWSFVRYARLDGDDTVVPVKLHGVLSDGDSFVAEAEVTVSLGRRD
jgi:hypothetical protein